MEKKAFCRKVRIKLRTLNDKVNRKELQILSFLSRRIMGSRNKWYMPLWPVHINSQQLVLTFNTVFDSDVLQLLLSKTSHIKIKSRFPKRFGPLNVVQPVALFGPPRLCKLGPWTLRRRKIANQSEMHQLN